MKPRNIAPDQQLKDPLQIQGAISRIIPFSSVDGPGNRFALFLQGCDFNCRYCHNPETRQKLPRPTKQVGSITQSGSKMVIDPAIPESSDKIKCSVPHWATVEQIMEQIRLVQPFIRGITISGGECLLQPEFCLALSQSALSLGLPTLLDSCGSVLFSQLPRLMKAIHGIMLDIKAWNSEEHRRLTGLSNQIVLENLEWAADHNLLQEVRTVIVPGEFNGHETVKQTASFLAQKKVLCPYVLIPFRPHGVRKPWNTLDPPSAQLMEDLRILALDAGCKQVIIR